MLGFTESFPKPKPEFPTSPGLPQANYPDVTNQFNTAKNNMYQGITKAQSSQGTSGVNSMFQKNFQPGGTWDLTSKPDFPSTDNQGQTQYAQFQGGRVTGDFLNHHMLGLGIAASGQHPDFGLLDGEPQIGTPYTAQQLPDGMNHPQAIASGYKSYLGDTSWQNQAMDNVPQNTSDDGGIVLKGQVSKGGGFPTPPEPTPQPEPAPDPTPNPDPDPNPFPFPWGFLEEDPTTKRIPQVQSYSPQIPSPSPTQGDSDPMAGLLRHQMRFDAMNQTSFHPFQLPQPILPSLSTFQQPSLHSTPSVRVQYGGVMVHPQHAQEMAQVNHVYTQAGQQPLQPEEISNWPVNRQTHVGLANQLQHHMTMRSWQPSPQQIQARNFQVGSRGGLDNHPNDADYHANTGYELLNAGVDRLNNGPEQSVGSNSNSSPIKLKELHFQQAFYHYQHGQGQSVIIPFNSIDFSEFNLATNPQFIKALQKGPRTDKNFKMHVNYSTAEKLPNIQHLYLGNITVQIQGSLKIDKNGDWRFQGIILPAYGSWNFKSKKLPKDILVETYDFDPQNRPFLKEMLTRLGHGTPGVDYKIYFESDPNHPIILNQGGQISPDHFYKKPNKKTF